MSAQAGLAWRLDHRAGAALLAAAVLAGCKSAPQAPPAKPHEGGTMKQSAGPGIPDELRSEVERAARIGRAIHRDDDASARATDAEAAAMFRARSLVVASGVELAKEANQGLCRPPYNVTVLPAALLGEDGWLVYLLAATADANQRVLTGHMRVHVSPDGATVRRTTALSRGCSSWTPPPRARAPRRACT